MSFDGTFTPWRAAVKHIPMIKTFMFQETRSTEDVAHCRKTKSVNDGAR